MHDISTKNKREHILKMENLYTKFDFHPTLHFVARMYSGMCHRHNHTHTDQFDCIESLLKESLQITTVPALLLLELLLFCEWVQMSNFRFKI